jgi:hypothetical protein
MSLGKGEMDMRTEETENSLREKRNTEAVGLLIGTKTISPWKYIHQHHMIGQY